MPYFRESSRPPAGAPAFYPLTLEQIRDIIDHCIQPAHFYDGSRSLSLSRIRDEEVRWEIFQGRLLPASQTRLTERFDSWNVSCSDGVSGRQEPIISVKLSAAKQQLHVTRAVHCYAWEGYQSEDKVFLSREVATWVAELVGTIELREFADSHALTDEIICQIFQAIVGASRLPLTSVESPLPAFSLGQLGYFHLPQIQAGLGPVHDPGTLTTLHLGEHLNAREKAKLLELVLRTVSPEKIRETAGIFVGQWQRLGWPAEGILALLPTVFNEVSLTPYTNFVTNALVFVEALVAMDVVAEGTAVDFFSYMLRQNARHLTAYDLFTFHHRGANYPDGLLLDEVLRAYLNKVECQPDLFLDKTDDDSALARRKRLRRRAVRQGVLLWYTYEGFPVPDMPTSPGENARILPAPFSRVPEEQIFVATKRRKKLFENAELPLTTAPITEVLKQSFIDLGHAEEIQELGMALYLDRPLGVSKAPGEADQTPLLSYELFSQSRVHERLRFLEQLPALASLRPFLASKARLANQVHLNGLPLRADPSHARPGAVALEDAVRIAPDFLVLGTTVHSARYFINLFDLGELAKRFDVQFLDSNRPIWIIRSNAIEQQDGNIISIFDDKLRRRLELTGQPFTGYWTRAGVELPRGGISVLRMWDPAPNGELIEHDLRQRPIALTIRD